MNSIRLCHSDAREAGEESAFVVGFLIAFAKYQALNTK